MISVRIVCIGKLKEEYWRAASAEYAKRLGRFCKFSIKELPEKRSECKSEAEIDAVRRAEGKSIVDALDGYTIALDGRGREYTSEQLADKLDKLSRTTSRIDIAIGGSWGLSDQVRERADEIVSLGKITYPHQLARIVAQEQLYRAFTINNNVAYHK